MTSRARVWVGSLVLVGCGVQIDSASPPPTGDEILVPSPHGSYGAGGFDADGRWHDVPGDPALTTPAAFAVWVGEVEVHVSNVLLPDGEDPWIAFRPERLTLVLGLDAAGAPVGGSLTFGAAPPLPPPSDPEGWYPPGFTAPNLVSPIWPGFEYPLRSLLTSGRRLSFSLSPGDVFTTWCALQTAHPVDDPPGFACFEGPSPSPSELPSSSPRAVMCRGPEPCCSCDAGGCRENAGFRIPFEMEMDGDRALGRVLGRAGLWDLSLVLVDEISLPARE